jgi:hypothetical protein
MVSKEALINEIRINSKYTNLYSSEYDSSLDNESTPIIKKRSLLTQDYLRRITSNVGQETSILPANCRYIERLNDGNIVIIEEPPAYRTLRFTMDFYYEYKKLFELGKIDEYGYDKNEWSKKDRTTKSFNLALPYVIFVLYLNEENRLSAGQIYFRIARMIGLSDYLLKAPFPNIAENQLICFGSNGGMHPTLNGGVEAAINNFWAAEFNTDYTYNYRAYQNVAGVSTYMEWHALSQMDPMFIYNVQWIKIPMNVGQAVDEMKRQFSLSSPTNMRYQTLTQMFSRPMDTGKDIALSKRSRRKHRLYFDVAEGMFLDERFYTHVGDPILIKNGKEKCYINSLISFIDSGDIKYVRVEREDGRLILYKLTKPFRKYLLDRVKELRYETEAKLKNGVIIKDDDIVQIKTMGGNVIYKKVSCIRKMQDGTHEAQFGDGFYILEHTEAEVFDIGKPKFKDVVLEKDKKYLYLSHNNVPFSAGACVEYSTVNTDHRGNLNIELLDIDKNRRHDPINISLGKPPSNVELVNFDSVKPLPGVFRVGRSLLSLHYEKPINGKAYGTPYGVIYERTYGRPSKPTTDDIKQYLMGENKFHIQSFDMDVEFSIGDKVVVADWENPINMLSVKIIQGFKFSEDSGDIHFILADKHGDLHQVRYVDGINGTVFVGRIRKITNVYKGIKSGTKIKAKEAGIPYFPKKDTNIIIGFITDTDGPEPLVLCSNCCTLWFNDVNEKFSKLSMKSKKWASIPHAPIDISKIKYQSGDIIMGTGDYRTRRGWLIFNITDQKAPKAIDLNYYISYPDYYTIDKYMMANSRLDCIPNPRFTGKDKSEGTMKPGWPNLHGHFFTCNSSRFYFMEDERSMIDVQSSPE